MNNTIKLAMIGTLMGIGLAQTNAQTTNVLANMTITGTVYAQTSDGVVTIKRVTTKDALKLLADNLGITLSNRAKLVVASPVGGGNPEVRLVNGADVTVLTPDNLSLIPGAQVANVRGNRETDYGIWTVSFDAGSGNNFESQGFGTFFQTFGIRPNTRGTISFAGSGSSGGSPAVIKGTVASKGKTFEVLQ